MSSATPSASATLAPGPPLVAMRRRELGLARTLGAGAGLFLLLWTPVSLARWSGVGPAWAYFEAGFFVFYGLLLLFPYSRVRAPRAWRPLFITLTVTSILFMFVLIFDVLFIANLFVDKNPDKDADTTPPALYVYSENSGQGPKLPFPALNCALVFIGLMQVPVVLFMRHPEWMD